MATATSARLIAAQALSLVNEAELSNIRPSTDKPRENTAKTPHPAHLLSANSSSLQVSGTGNQECQTYRKSSPGHTTCSARRRKKGPIYTCQTCGKPSPRRNTCSACSEKKTCQTCGNPSPGLNTCRPCFKRMSKLQKCTMQKDGKICGKPSYGSSYCITCRRKKSLIQTCQTCGKPSAGRNTCRTCQKKKSSSQECLDTLVLPMSHDR